jgi:UDP-glucose 4-epimerase
MNTMSRPSILVTGGAGYIGSHVVCQLREAGARVVVIDDLSTGVREAAQGAPLVVGDVGDADLVARVLREYAVDTIMHFAARTVVPESVAEPMRYYRNNTCATRNLIECAAAAQVKHFVFSSTGAVYGIPPQDLASEDTTPMPINPYGASKLMSEWMLRDVCAMHTMRYVTLRYFNVAGCDPQGRIGQNTPHATLLIKVACEAAYGRRKEIAINGTDFPTPDGTGVRDYVHVDDLARAHVAAFDYLRQGGASITLNVGYGHGYSVREVLTTVERLHGAPLPIVERARRPGDPPRIVADARKIRQILDWAPRHDDLEFIVRTSLAWERKLAARHAAAQT